MVLNISIQKEPARIVLSTPVSEVKRTRPAIMPSMVVENTKRKKIKSNSYQYDRM
jgi:hypothetical protein